jgi:2-polyprenyl-6-methoxyphenol hydroxylase-like FAD-dependent oxidoreductase
MRDETERQQFVDRKRRNRMAEIDRQSPEIRALVHIYGWHVVDMFLRNGVTKAKHIRHLVETVLDEFSPTRGSFSAQGVRAPLITKSGQGER